MDWAGRNGRWDLNKLVLGRCVHWSTQATGMEAVVSTVGAVLHASVETYLATLAKSPTLLLLTYQPEIACREIQTFP